ncbi:DUF3050 domain-containing protein [Streptomyces sp. NPDC001388]|uniref:DUF3050 domain-containing protein n=1 Tax=Streptomyces sp. NPDC001388 TaxID=3364568 RepID=UPI00367FFCCE
MSRYGWNLSEEGHEGIGGVEGIERARSVLGSARKEVASHPLYRRMSGREHLKTFMAHHVFAVWDSMSLLKSLQHELTCVDVPRVPRDPAVARRLVNAVVLVEESDELNGGFTSHFELYRAAMAEVSADTTRIDTFIALIEEGHAVSAALRVARVPAPAAAFVTTTFDIVAHRPLHCRAAAFAFSREDLLPDLFRQVIEEQGTGRFPLFRDHLARRIEADGEERTPLALQMVADLCGTDDTRWQEAVDTVKLALEARCRLWDGIMEAMP